jgi:hypothetical protein
MLHFHNSHWKPNFYTWLLLWLNFSGIRIWTQGFFLARQIFYHWAMHPSLFCCSNFSGSIMSFLLVNVLRLWFSYLCLPCGWNHRCEPPYLDYLLLTFALKAYNCCLPYLHLISSWGCNWEFSYLGLDIPKEDKNIDRIMVVEATLQAAFFCETQRLV